jgi:hypothetical protein
MALAQDGSPDAARVLTQGVTRLEDEDILAIVVEALSQLRKPACIDSVCKVWATTRHQKLTNLLVKKGWVASAPVEVRILTALKTGQLQVVTGGGKEIVEPLLRAFKDKDSEIASRASQSAIALTNPDAIDYLCQQWVKTRDKLLEQVICQGKYVARQPIEVRVLTALKVGKRRIIASENAVIIDPLLQACQNSDRAIATEANTLLGELKNQSAINALCNEWAKTRAQHLAEALQRGQYVATHPIEVRVLTALKIARLAVFSNGGQEIVEPLLEAFKDRDSEIASRASQSAIALTNPDAIDYFCQQWVNTRDKLLEQVLCQGKYVAREPIEVRVCTALPKVVMRS